VKTFMSHDKSTTASFFYRSEEAYYSVYPAGVGIDCGRWRVLSLDR